MMTTLLNLVAILALNTSDLNEDYSLKKEAKLISEILENMQAPEFDLTGLENSKTISIYTPEGELIDEFSEDNYNARALRNTDFLLEDATSKIFIKYRN